jgi:acyl carrier protein
LNSDEKTSVEATSTGVYEDVSQPQRAWSVDKQADVISRLQAIFREELDLPDLQISPQSTPSDVDGWDSLATIRIVAAVEREFDREFEAAQIESIRSMGDLISMIAA